MKIINRQFNEDNSILSTLWLSESGEYILEKDNHFTKIVEIVKPTITELSNEQISSLKNLYEVEFLNPKKELGDEFIGRIS